VNFGSSSVGPLIDTLAKVSDTTKRRQIIRCLGDLKDDRATNPLRAFLEFPDYETRVDARHATDLIAGTRSDPWFGPGGE
jgi:HEAT repeat protein